jgi:hypothetical protein
MPTRRRRAQFPRLGLLGLLLTQRKLREILFEKSSFRLRAEERTYTSQPHGSLELFLHGFELLQPGQLGCDIHPSGPDETILDWIDTSLDVSAVGLRESSRRESLVC